MVRLSKAQRKSLHRVWLRNPNNMSYRQFRRTVEGEFFGGGAVIVPWCGMWLGIEPDGYTHS